MLNSKPQLGGAAFLIWFIPLLLSLCGLLMISSLALRNSVAGGNPYSSPVRQAQFLGIGLAFMMCCIAVPMRSLQNNSGLIWLGALILVFLTLMPGIGVKAGGAQRWIRVLGFRFQPLEFLLFAVPIFMANRLASVKRRGFDGFVRPTLMVIGISAVFLYFQPNLGGIILVTSICLLMHIESRGWRWPLIAGALGVVAVMILIYTAPYRRRRLQAFLDPWADPTGKGFQIIQGLVAFVNGGVSGVGVGKGFQSERYLPESTTDYIYAAIGEEFGLIGTGFLLAMYALWTYRAFLLYKRARAKSAFLASLTFGLTASVICPMFLNLAGVMKLAPLAGVPLSFISAGGSSMIFMWAKVGLLLSINRLVRDG